MNCLKRHKPKYSEFGVSLTRRSIHGKVWLFFFFFTKKLLLDMADNKNAFSDTLRLWNLNVEATFGVQCPPNYAEVSVDRCRVTPSLDLRL